MRFRYSLAAALTVLPLAACSGASSEPGSQSEQGGGSTMDPVADGMIDARVTPPPGGSDVVDFESVELTVPPGEERQFCIFMTSPSEDLFIQKVEQYQGEGGHHAVMLTTESDEPDGTWVDCTEAEDMADYSLTLLPLELPEGFAQRLPANQKMVLQSHYINTHPEPMKVRDIVRLYTVDEADVDTPAAPFATHNYDVAVPPGGSREVSFECEVPRDAGLITVGGHLHEEGASFKLEHGKTETDLETVYEIPEWDPEYRDSPPIDNFPTNPLPMKAGDTLRTTCAWNNTKDHVLGWPEEMCASFGLIAGSFEPYECNLGAPTEDY